MSEQIKVAQINQVVPNKGLLVKAKGREIALFKVDGAIYAISHQCPHSTGPLAEGRLYGNIVTCPWHGAQFDVTTGRCHAGPAARPVQTYPVIIEGNSIFVEVT